MSDDAAKQAFLGDICKNIFLRKAVDVYSRNQIVFMGS